MGYTALMLNLKRTFGWDKPAVVYLNMFTNAKWDRIKPIRAFVAEATRNLHKGLPLAGPVRWEEELKHCLLKN